MSDRTLVRRPSSIAPWGVIGALGLVLLVESSVSRHQTALTDTACSAYEYAGGSVRKAVDAEVIGFGDSLVKFGVFPRAIEQRTGKRTYNLAVAASTAPLSYYLLKRALNQGARPSAILVSYKSTQLQIDPMGQVEAFSGVLGLREIVDMAWTAKDGIFLARVLTAKILPSLRNRAGVRAFVVTSFGGNPFTYLSFNLTSYRNGNVNRGGGLLPKNPAVESQTVYWDELFYDHLGDWAMNPLNAVYVRRFLSLAASRKIPVYWVAAPVNPRVQAKRERLGYDQKYTRLLRRAVGQFPDLTVVDGRYAGYPTRLFIDGAHLDAEGAYTFSLELADVLRRDDSSPRSRSHWVDLPAFRPHHPPADLEDENVSRYVLFGGHGPAPPVFATGPAPVRR